MDTKFFIDVDEGIEILLRENIKYDTEEVDIEDALSRIAAEDINTVISVPYFDKSPYDGYAFRGEDTKGASKDGPARLKVVEEIPAGKWPEREIHMGEAAKILTGAPVPKGANVCYKFEKTKTEGENVLIFEEISPNKDIIKVGEDVKKGTLLVKKGDKFDVGLIGQISGQGIKTVKVYKKPIAGIFATGSELLSAGEELQNGKIYNSNTITFTNILKKLGFDVLDFGVVRDDEEKIEELTKSAIDKVDVLFSTGGASVGDYDYAFSSVKNLGGEILFWKTNLKPGGSIVVSKLNEKIVFGLSGNPAASIISFYRLCLPFLKKMTGREDILHHHIFAVMKHPLNKKSHAIRLLRGHLEFEDGKVYFSENEEQGNGVLSSFVNCDAFAEIQEGSDEINAGEIVKVYRVGSIFGEIGE